MWKQFFLVTNIQSLNYPERILRFDLFTNSEHFSLNIVYFAVVFVRVKSLFYLKKLIVDFFSASSYTQQHLLWMKTPLIHFVAVHFDCLLCVLCVKRSLFIFHWKSYVAWKKLIICFKRLIYNIWLGYLTIVGCLPRRWLFSCLDLIAVSFDQFIQHFSEKISAENF